MPMKAIAEQYVKLVLALGQHDADYVDAYYGPREWKAEAEQRKLPLAEIAETADRLVQEIGEPGEDLRQRYLRRQLQAVAVRARMLSGLKLSFDEESQALYDAVAPTHPDSYFQDTINQFEMLLPGKGTLIERFDAFRGAFVIPPNKLAEVFVAAVAEGRKRTMPHVDLPATETFTIEYVTNKAWSGYNWYQGNYRSLIQVNTDLPIYIDRAIDLACHEGYPGHHVYNALLEKHLMRDRGCVEMSVYALFSPQSLIAEGTANYGIEVAFPDDERLAFERDVLFPKAGLDASRTAEYNNIRAVADRLSYAGNEAARRYLDGQIDRNAAAEWLTRFAMMSTDRAEQRVRFFEKYRSYVINYNLGKDLVKRYIEKSADRWHEFVKLLSSPRLPSGL